MKLFAQCAAVALITGAVTTGLVIGTTPDAPVQPAPVPSYFCPAGQHATRVVAGSPECTAPPEPLKTAIGVAP